MVSRLKNRPAQRGISTLHKIDAIQFFLSSLPRGWNQMAEIASVFAVIFLITSCAALDNTCTCTPNTNDTTTFTLSTPGLPTCVRQWMDENDTVLTYNGEFDKTRVLSLTLQSLITKGCPEKLKYSEDYIHRQDPLREVVCLCDCHGYNKPPVQPEMGWYIWVCLPGLLILLLLVVGSLIRKLNSRSPVKKELLNSLV